MPAAAVCNQHISHLLAITSAKDLLCCCKHAGLVMWLLNHHPASSATTPTTAAPTTPPHPPPGHHRYQDLTTYIFRSKRLGTWTLLPFQMAVLVGMALTYTVVGAEDLKQLVGILSPDTHLSLWTYLVAFGAVEVLLSMVRKRGGHSPAAAALWHMLLLFLSLVPGTPVYAVSPAEQPTPPADLPVSPTSPHAAPTSSLPLVPSCPPSTSCPWSA